MHDPPINSILRNPTSFNCFPSRLLLAVSFGPFNLLKDHHTHPRILGIPPGLSGLMTNILRD